MAGGAGFLVFSAACFLLIPFVGLSFFPRTDAGQFVINVKAPTGTRIEMTNEYVSRSKTSCGKWCRPSNWKRRFQHRRHARIFPRLFTPNSGMHTAFVQVGLKEDHEISSFVFMAAVRDRIARELPELRTYFQSGGLVDAVLNQGVPAPIDVQVSGVDLEHGQQHRPESGPAIQGPAGRLGRLHSAGHGLSRDCKLNVNRARASELGLDPKEVIDNMITALTSDEMIAPGYWVDPRSGNNYFVTVQYPENQVTNVESLKAMPLRAPNLKAPTYLNQVADVSSILTPTEVDHYQLQRDFDIYVAPTGEDLGKLSTAISKIIANTKLPPNIRVDTRGLVVTMNQSFKSFGLGLFLAILLVYLILVAQFKSFIDPFLIVLAVPTGIVGVILTLVLTGTTLNIQSLDGHRHAAGHGGLQQHPDRGFRQCSSRRRAKRNGSGGASLAAFALRPILMTSLATVVGLLPMAFKLETGSEAYAPLARVIIGGLLTSIVLTIFVVPAAYLLIYRRRDQSQMQRALGEAQ